MADNKKTKTSTTKNPLIGSQTKPTVLAANTQVSVDTTKSLVDNIIGTGLSGGLNIAALEDFTTIANSRDQIYQMIDTMSADSSVSALLRTYAENVCEIADNGHVVWCEASDPKISKFVNYVLDVMNVDKNIFGWTYCLLKYGDVYLRLFRESDYADDLFKQDNVDKLQSAKTVLTENVTLAVHNSTDQYSYYAEMVPDPGTMFELTKYGKTYGFVETPNIETGFNTVDLFNPATGQNTLTSSYRLKSTDVNVYQADDFVHACLDDNFSRFPETVEIFTNDSDFNTGTNPHTYRVKRGKSLLYDSYKIWREKSLLENAALMSRVTRSSRIRKVQVEVGDMPKEEVKKTLRKVKELLEQRTAVREGQGFAEYTNPGPVENNVYFATHNGQGAVSVESLGDGDVNISGLADLDWWNNKFYSSYGIPKQYFGWTDDGAGFNGGSSLTILSSVFAKGVRRVQNAMLQALTDAINLILINKGCRSYVNNFVLKMKAPLTQEEKDYREDLANRVNAISSIQSLFTDVEDRARKLKILRELLKTLNYGDNFLQELDEEIKVAEEVARQQQAEAEKAAEEQNRADESSSTSDSETQLGDSSVAENLKHVTSKSEAIILTESDLEGTEAGIVGAEAAYLPTPDELDETIDFSENV